MGDKERIAMVTASCTDWEIVGSAFGSRPGMFRPTGRIETGVLKGSWFFPLSIVPFPASFASLRPGKIKGKRRVTTKNFSIIREWGAFDFSRTYRNEKDAWDGILRNCPDAAPYTPDALREKKRVSEAYVEAIEEYAASLSAMEYGHGQEQVEQDDDTPNF